MVDLTKSEIELLIEALDSHVYWQLSEAEFRHDGTVWEPGSRDPENAAEIVRSERLSARLSAVLDRVDP